MCQLQRAAGSATGSSPLHCLHLSFRICLTYTYRPLYPITLEYHTGHCKSFSLFFALLFLSIPQLLTMSGSVKLLVCYADTFKIPQILRSSAICSLCGNFASSAETYPPMYARLFPAPNRRPYRSVIFLHSSGRRSILRRRGKCRAY